MKKLLPRLLLVLVVVAVVGYFTRNTIARRSVEMGVETITGFPMEIASVNISLFTSKLDVRGIKLKNPPEFPEPLFVEMPQLFVDYRIGSMLIGAPHIYDMLIHIDHLVLVTNEKGESNVQKLKGVTTSDSESKSKYHVDQLRVQVGKVTIKKYGSAKPYEKTMTLNLNRTYNNISDATDITRLVLLTVAGNVPLPDLGLNTADLTKNLGGVTDAAGKTVGGAMETIGKTGKGLLEELKKAVPQK